MRSSLRNHRPAACPWLPSPLLALLLLTAGLSGCALLHKDVEDPAFSQDAAPLFQGTPLPYVSRIVVEGSPETKDLTARMQKNSQLAQLAKEPPDSLLGLERRARVDQETGIRLLHSLGYFDGKASFTVDAKATPVSVTLMLNPGPRYTVDFTHITYAPAPVVPPAFRNRTQKTGFIFQRTTALPDPVFPDTLSGIEPDITTGIPAAAAPLLDAAGKLPGFLQREGYPFARVAHTQYSLNHEAHTLRAKISVDPGPPAVMDGIQVSGAKKVNPAYLERLIPWQTGEIWDVRQMEAYRDTLRQLGLFRSVQVKPLPSASDLPPTSAPSSGAPATTGELTDIAPLAVPVAIEVAETAFRTVSTSARYATDVGFGVQGAWEHRNLFGNGELLKLKMPLTQDLQGFSANFEKPAFGRTDQKLLAGSSLAREKTDAYTKTAATAYAGLERRLAAHWWAEGRFFLENGALNEGMGKNQYRFLSFSLTLKRDTRNNPLNPIRGSRLTLTMVPYSGFYGDAFTTVAFKMDASAYYAPFHNDSLVLAARATLGSMTGSPSASIPASLRYYAGGGGSVRGYAYQALGPRDAHGDPRGGRSFQAINLEARFKITEYIGIVPFVDGGMVYESKFPKLGQKLDWALGLGLRYFTPVGPVRVDLAFPMTHLGHDKRFQFYISIGQAF